MRIKAFRKTSVSIFGKSGGLFERQVRKMACHFAPPSEFRTPQKYQLRFSLRKRPMRRGLWYFLSAQKVRKKKVLFLGYSLHKAKFSYVLCCAKNQTPGTREKAVVTAFVRKLQATFLSRLLLVAPLLS